MNLLYIAIGLFGAYHLLGKKKSAAVVEKGADLLSKGADKLGEQAARIREEEEQERISRKYGTRGRRNDERDIDLRAVETRGSSTISGFDGDTDIDDVM